MNFEDMVIKSIDYDVESGKILSMTPYVLENQTLKNNSDDKQEMLFVFSEAITHTSMFGYTTGFTITVGTEFSEPRSHFVKTYTANFPVKAGLGKTVCGVLFVQKGTLEVPYTIQLASKSTGVWVETKGIWRGVSSWELHHLISVEKGTQFHFMVLMVADLSSRDAGGQGQLEQFENWYYLRLRSIEIAQEAQRMGDNTDVHLKERYVDEEAAPNCSNILFVGRRIQ
ncbi:hypothetical protein IW261DRAFT_1423968 [Armillaria novae-zelandiae]|uniref:Uncharacterized protein n=1 Tax=Armillaria novae-zelandiae TaxID=153914 RepID=A0AA39NW52_9AGAR|nr:hypothetical protein IW261DRAFT_1423968 [Armillaria novae-zelandiae]